MHAQSHRLLGTCVLASRTRDSLFRRTETVQVAWQVPHTADDLLLLLLAANHAGQEDEPRADIWEVSVWRLRWETED